MKDAFVNSIYFGIVLSLMTYMLGVWLKKKLKWGFVNPLLISVVVIIGVLLLADIDYESYNKGGQYISYLLTPATVCLAIPMYKQLHLLKAYRKAVVFGLLAGVIASLGSVLGLSVLFGLTHQQYVTLLPKSITTAIGLGVSQELGGLPAITVAVIIITGLIGNVTAQGFCRLLRIKDPVAVGLAIGTSAHALGTAKALELGEVQGAMSSLAIVAAGLLTVVGASVFAMLW
jgi:predicted murein hydrolase (TIGR00659 family)